MTQSLAKRDGQVRKICNALLQGRRLTNLLVARIAKTTAPATRMSDVARIIPLEKEWVVRNGRRFLEYSWRPEGKK